MDMQLDILGICPNATIVVSNVAEAIGYFRKNDITVIYVVIGFRKGMPEVGTTNKTFSTCKIRVGNTDTSEMMKVHPALAPLNSEIVVTKRRYSAFTGSDLELVLRSLQIKHLILTGVSTSGVVLSTVRAGFFISSLVKASFHRSKTKMPLKLRLKGIVPGTGLTFSHPDTPARGCTKPLVPRSGTRFLFYSFAQASLARS
jgi:nicotinamidase-related amidase